MVHYALGTPLRHRDLGIVGVVESEFPVSVHRMTSGTIREMVNVAVGEDSVWWDSAKVEPIAVELAENAALPVLPTEHLEPSVQLTSIL